MTTNPNLIDGSLRERNKARRRLAIERSALELFAELGYDDTTVASIAERAEVSPRTVSLHFPTKIELYLASVNEGLLRLADALRERGGRGAVDVFASWLWSLQIDPDPLGPVRVAALKRNPSLRGVRTAALDSALAAGREALAAELRVSADSPEVGTALAAISGILTDFELISASDPRAAYDCAMRFIRAGLEGLRRPEGTTR